MREALLRFADITVKVSHQIVSECTIRELGRFVRPAPLMTANKFHGSSAVGVYFHQVDC
jgi:hypothetical protein